MWYWVEHCRRVENVLKHRQKRRRNEVLEYRKRAYTMAGKQQKEQKQ